MVDHVYWGRVMSRSSDPPTLKSPRYLTAAAGGKLMPTNSSMENWPATRQRHPAGRTWNAGSAHPHRPLSAPDDLLAPLLDAR